MDQNVIVVIVAYVLYGLSFASIPMRKKQVVRETGKLVYSFGQKIGTRVLLIDVFSAALIALAFLNYSNPIIRFILAGCGVMGAFISTNDIIYKPLYGVYENGIISTEKYIKFDDIITFPVLNLPAEEQKDYPKNPLVLSTKTRGEVLIYFDSNEQSEVIQKVIFENHPEYLEHKSE